MQFTWISSAEAGKFQTKAKEVVENIQALGPNNKLRKDIKASSLTAEAAG